jgi:hypothetical protein
MVMGEKGENRKGAQRIYYHKHNTKNTVTNIDLIFNL